MLTTRTSIAVALSLVIAASTTRADPGSESGAQEHWHLALDIDLNTIAELGGAGWLMVKPPSAPHWRFGAGGFFTGVPGVFVDLDGRNAHEGWNVRPRGILGFVDWYPSSGAPGFYVGAYFGYVAIRYTRDAMAGAATIDHVSFEPHVGYQWFPSSTGFYVQPWLGVAILAKTGGDSAVGDQTYAERSLVPLYGLNVGYELR